MFYAVEYVANGEKAFVNFGERYRAACALARRVSATIEGGVDVVFYTGKEQSVWGICRYRNGKRAWTDGPMTVTPALFKAVTGYDPINDDIERINCKSAGKPGHEQCGFRLLKEWAKECA